MDYFPQISLYLLFDEIKVLYDPNHFQLNK